MLWTLSQVALGGAIGAIARYLAVLSAARWLGNGFPVGTLVVNVVGSFAMGVLFVWLTERDLLRHAPLLMAGFLGGFTTFSAFSLDAVLLWERGAEGLALVYVAASVVLAVAALLAGVVIMRGLLS